MTICIMHDNMYKDLYIDTFKVAADRFSIEGVILHSDCGSQYTSDDFRKELAHRKDIQSLSGVG